MIIELYLLLLALAVVFTFSVVMVEFMVRRKDIENISDGTVKRHYTGPKYFSILLCLVTMLLWFAVGVSSINVEMYNVDPALSGSSATTNLNSTYSASNSTYTYTFISNSHLYYTSEMLGLFFFGNAMGLVFMALSIYMIVDVRRSI